MASGHANADLGRITHDAAFATPRCEGCNALNREPAATKPRALRIARAHVAETGHTATILIAHWQRVHPA